ncbi:hypothetical protein CRENBAI_012563 [Crenichthys baileyi]|uniref:Uncharacterized protein n=1 Tax=Crenichthys baileyi TaxID=28760 RepID=A0AAV9R9I4_9TELE
MEDSPPRHVQSLLTGCSNQRQVNQTPQCLLQCQLCFPFSHQLHLLLQPSLRVLQTLQLLSPLGFSKTLQHSSPLEVSRAAQHLSPLEISQTSQLHFQPSQTNLQLLLLSFSSRFISLGSSGASSPRSSVFLFLPPLWVGTMP